MSSGGGETQKKKGRPRVESIPRFNVDTFLCCNRKFLTFSCLSGCDDRAAWTHIVRYFNFVNANCAMNAQLDERDIAPLARFCWWEREPEEFYRLLKASGFLHEDGTVHEQDVHQPLAAEIKRKRAESRGGEGKWATSGALGAEEMALNGQNSSNYEPITYNQKPGGNTADIPAQVVEILSRIGHRTGIKAYQEVTLDDWSTDIMREGQRIGFQCMLRQAERFEQWFIGRVEAKKINPDKNHVPRTRFLNNWLGNTKPEHWTTGDGPEGTPAPSLEQPERIYQGDVRLAIGDDV